MSTSLKEQQQYLIKKGKMKPLKTVSSQSSINEKAKVVTSTLEKEQEKILQKSSPRIKISKKKV